MKISLNWLKQYINIDVSTEDLAAKLTLVGLEVEDITSVGASFSGVFVGEILSVDKHPNADRLSVCQVSMSTETLNIVCGAPNVSAGQIVAVAKVGAVLEGGFKITPAKLRGVKSFGMLCSERELGISDSHDSIMALDPDKFVVGNEFSLENSLEPDIVFEIAITPNRPDCLSHLGVAREVAAIFNTPLNIPDINIKESTKAVESLININIQDVQGCPRYSARVIKNVKISESPQWLKERLEAVNLRSINNVVDITNFVLMETGHPLHAFDYNTVEDHKIIIRNAKQDESFTTLDSQKHKLDPGDLLICDGLRAIALAGIMGGQNSEISDSTVNILLESAYFDPKKIRRTAKRLGLSTDASQRFERGADPNGVIYALDRAAQLMAEYADGEISQGIIDCYPKKINEHSVNVRPARVNHVLGSNFSVDIMTDVFNRLYLTTTGKDPITVTIPTFRPDLTHEIDLIEEVVRLHGFDKITPKALTTIPLSDNRNTQVDFIDRIRDFFIGSGFNECVHSSMVPEWQAGIEKDRMAISIKNPLSPETACLRTRILPSLLSAVVWNQNRSESNLKLFEIGKQFCIENGKYYEALAVSAVITGIDNRGSYWSDDNKKWDFNSIKGVMASLSDSLHIKLDMDVMKHSLYNNEQSVGISLNNQSIGHLGRVHTKISEKWNINNDVFAFEILISPMSNATNARTQFIPLPKYPAVKRDLAFVVDSHLHIGEIINVINESGGETCTNVDLFDIYHGDQIPSNKKSAAFALTFMSLERTLTDKEIDPLITKIVNAVEKHFQAVLRS
ncbi:phenylalanine--tRNA ligase subunit beta [bacterium]|nr:phenylalanine--tRNA ligase subunit beta [bacterium]